MLKFEISSSRIVCPFETEKKYVAYTLSVSQDTADPETSKPSSIERRYTDFLNLYNGLKREQPSMMAGVSFPKKVVMGNFDPELISCRSTGFESLLDHIASESKMREAACTIDFFQNAELFEAKKFMREKKFDQALCLLENNFKLLNKLYTDRSRVVLVSLCRLVACGAGSSRGKEGEEAPGRDCALAGPVERWASLAMRRFDGVSDADLLTLYVPLIQACISIWKILGKDCQTLESDLVCMKRRGMKVDACPDLINAIDQLERAVVTTP